MELRRVKRKAIARFSTGAVILGTVFFLSAGTIRYWEAWVYLVVLFLPVALALRHLLRHDPELLARRLAAREERKQQRAVQLLSSIAWVAVFLIPGLDRRFGWSSVPWPVAAASDIVVLGGYLLFLRVLQENSYASRIVEVQEGQRVITTGPYALVRHPMYLAILTMLLFSPLALGSYWAEIPALLTPFFLVMRIHDEEAMLSQQLAGFRDYTQQTRYRLVPGVW